MGRRGVPVGEDAKWVFNRLAADYPARPGYPEALVDRLVELASTAGGRVVEIGAGTGALAIPLARRGLDVAAVEPARAMLEQAQKQARENGVSLRLVHAAGEETGLGAGAFDLALLADSLQWLDPELGPREVGRLLRPQGILAVVEVAWAPTPFMDGLSRLFATANPKACWTRVGVDRFVRAAVGTRQTTLERFEQRMDLGPDALGRVLGTFSYGRPALGEHGFAKLVREAIALAFACKGAVWATEIHLTWALWSRELE